MNKATATSVSRQRRPAKAVASRSATVVPEKPVEPAVEQVVEPVNSVETVDTVVETTDELTMDILRTRFEALLKSKQDRLAEAKKEVLELKKMQKDYEKLLKDNMKKTKKKRVSSNTNRKPSGFASAVVVSDELYSFLAQFGVKKGDPIARTEVTRHIASYIKSNDLQNPDYRREIVPDATLKKLFGPPIELKDPSNPSSPKVYSYMRLQKYLSPHFPKKN